MKSISSKNFLHGVITGSIVTLIIGIAACMLFVKDQKNTIPVLPTTSVPGEQKMLQKKNVYRNSFGFSLQYPETWTIEEKEGFVAFINPTGQRLSFAYKTKGQNKTIVRSGVGGGDLIERGTVRFNNQNIPRFVLVSENKDIGVFYNKASEIEAGNIVFSINLDNQFWNNQSENITGQTQKNADAIVESFSFLAPS